jgi:phenylpropionate dioxygenase-like ring-hydroxylating dioxygenase large terminal subunit
MPQVSEFIDFPGGVAAHARNRATLDADQHTSLDFMKLEWKQIWTKAWLFAGLESDIPERGDYFIYNLGRESIVVMRQQDGSVASFYNACQHRGNRIFTGDWGSVADITCPYHGWTYEIDGALKKVPDEERFANGVPCAERSLKPVKTELWAGLVWINMNPDAAPLHKFLGLIIDQLTPFHFEDMVLVKHQTVSLDTNWKTAKDNFLEQYHVDFIHPQHASFVDCYNSTNDLWPYGHTCTRVEGYVTNPRYPIPVDPPEFMKVGLAGLGLDPNEFDGRVRDIRAAVQKQKRIVGAQLGHDYSELSDEQVSDVWQYDFFPNLFMTIKPEELWIYGPRPHPSDPNKCFFDKWTLQIPMEAAFDGEKGLFLGADPTLSRPSDSDRPEREVFTRDDVIAGRNSMTITIDQDIFYLNDMQNGLHSQGFDRALLNEDEARVQHFHDWVDDWVEDDPLSSASADPQKQAAE